MKQPFIEIHIKNDLGSSRCILNENHVVRFWKADNNSTDVMIELTTGEIIRSIHPTYDEWHDDCLQRKE